MNGTKTIKLKLPETLLVITEALAQHDKCEATDILYCLLTNGIARLIEQNIDNQGLCACLMRACNDIDRLAARHLPREEAEISRKSSMWRIP